MQFALASVFLKILGNYLRKQPSIVKGRPSRFYAAHLEYPGRVKFLRTSSKCRTKTSLIKRAPHITSTSLRKAIAANSASFQSTSTTHGGATR